MASSRPFRVLVTRAPHQASELADRLRALGCGPILIPAIETVEPISFAELDSALAEVQTFHWLIFTSANAVEVFASRRDRRALEGLGFSPSTQRIAVIGTATARALQTIGLEADLIPQQAVAESLTESLLPHALQPDGTPTRFLLIRAEEAREHLPEALRAAGAEVTIAPAYRTIIPRSSVEAIRQLFQDIGTHPDAITFTSSSTARNLFALIEAATVPASTFVGPARPVLASIGPITSGTLRDLGYEPDVESTEATVPALAETLVKYLRARS